MFVHVYRNLRQGCWSIKAYGAGMDGRVVAHTQGAVLVGGVDWVVSEAGRQRVLAERRKNVHATVRGDLLWLHRKTQFFHGMTADGLGARIAPSVNWTVRLPQRSVPVTYNPYEFDSFVRSADHEPVTYSDAAYLMPDGKARAKRTNALHNVA